MHAPSPRVPVHPTLTTNIPATCSVCRVHSDEGRAERGVTWQFKDPHAQGNSSSKRWARIKKDSCGHAAKVIFAENPWTKGKYSPTERGYTRKGLLYGKEEKLEVWQNTVPKKYAADVDPTMFEDPNWLVNCQCTRKSKKTLSLSLYLPKLAENLVVAILDSLLYLSMIEPRPRRI